MSKYHKIHAPFKRNLDVKPSHLIMGQWCKPEFEMLRNLTWNAHEKIDGTNIRVIYNPHSKKIEFKGRTDNADIPNHLLEYLDQTFTRDKLQEVFPPREDIVDQVILYGEGTGYKIQNGCKYFGGKKEVDFILFDVRIGRWWMQRKDVSIFANLLSLRSAPFVMKADLETLMSAVKCGLKSNFGDFYMEGLIAEPYIPLFTRSGERIITKIKHRDFF